MKKFFLFLALIIFTNQFAIAGCVTGYACSLDELRKEQKIENSTSDTEQKVEEKSSKSENEKNSSKEKSEDKNKQKKGFFVDGGKYNSPEYTEMFTFRGGLFY